jgi:hypothetical protein
VTSLSLDLANHTPLGLEGAGFHAQTSGMLTELAGGSFTPALSQTAGFTGLATGVAIPAAETLLAAMGNGGVHGVIDGAGEALGTAEVWRGVANILEGGSGHAITIDALLDALPSHGDAMPAIAASINGLDLVASHWMPGPDLMTMEAMAAHPDAVVTG